MRRYQGPVYRQCRRYLPEAEAEEVCQDTFVRAFTAIERFDPSRPLFPWLYTIAKRLCLDRLRRDRQDPTDDLETRVADSHAGPERQASGREMMVVLNKAMAELPEGQREVLGLFHIEGLPYKEIARIMELPMGTVMTWIHRGRKALREALAEAGADEAYYLGTPARRGAMT